MKFPLPQPGSRTRPAGEAERLHRRPDRLDERGVGVVRVEGVAGRGRQLPGRQQAGQLLAGPGVLRLAARRRPPGPRPTRTSGPAPPARPAWPGGPPARWRAAWPARRGSRGRGRPHRTGPGRPGRGGRNRGQLAALEPFLLLGADLRPHRVAAADHQGPLRALRRRVVLLRVLAGSGSGGSRICCGRTISSAWLRAAVSRPPWPGSPPPAGRCRPAPSPARRSRRAASCPRSEKKLSGSLIAAYCCGSHRAQWLLGHQPVPVHRLVLPPASLPASAGHRS